MRIPCTNWYKDQMLKVSLGLQSYIPIPTYLAVGTGGCPDGLNPIPPDPVNEQGLDEEVYRKEVSSRSMGKGLFGVVTASVSGSDVAGVLLTEAGLLDQKGNLIGRVTFQAKGMGDQTRIDFEFDWVL